MCTHIRYITDPQSGQDGERQKHELVVNAANFNQRLIRDGIAEVERTRQSGRMRRRRPPSRCPARVLRVIRRREVCAEGLLAGLSGPGRRREIKGSAELTAGENSRPGRVRPISRAVDREWVARLIAKRTAPLRKPHEDPAHAARSSDNSERTVMVATQTASEEEK